MLFDLQTGKRRRVVQVVYSLLAASFLVGFVIFGVGTGGLGGLSDVLGLGSGSGGSASTAFDSQISNAEDRLAKDPKDQAALLNVARYEYLTGQSELEQPSTPNAAPVVTDTARADLVKAVDAWERYVKLTDKPDPGVASQIAQGYAFLDDATGAARAQRIFAEAQPSANTYGTLALYLYANADLSAGDAAAKKAVAAAPGAQRKQIAAQLDQLGKRARQFKKAQAAAQKAGATGTTPGASGGGLQSPFGGLGPSGAGAPPTTP